ncbi:MAG: hypothetical protein ACXABY_28860, partial [Candidatus Thorarchaeota archaeon]
ESATTMVQPEEDDIQDVDWELSEVSQSAERTKKIAAAAILASLSVAVSPVAAALPRIPLFGIAVFDPISLFWVIAFLLGGIWVGLFSMIAGGIMLNFFDPFPIIGPLLKFLATVPLVILPWLAVRRNGDQEGRSILALSSRIGGAVKQGLRGGSALSKVRLYVALMFLAYLVRLTLMIPVNLVVVPFIWGISDPIFIISYTVVLNTIQSFWDAFLPFIVIHRTQVFKNYGMW